MSLTKCVRSIGDAPRFLIGCLIGVTLAAGCTGEHQVAGEIADVAIPEAIVEARADRQAAVLSTRVAARLSRGR